MMNEPVSKNQALRWSLAETMPDMSFLDTLDLSGLDIQDVTVINGAGNAWKQEPGGEWQPAANPSLSQSGGSLFKNRTDRPRILAITPFHPAYGIKPETLASINAAIMAYDGPIDWILSDSDNPHEVGFENVTYQHNKARDMVLSGGYDAMLSIEADMVVPADAIQKLLDCEADVAYGVYVWRHSLDRWSAYSRLGIFGGWSVSVKEDVRGLWGGIHDVEGVGMGCTLIKRRVLECFPFRLYTGDKDDWLIEKVVEGGRKMGFEIDPYRPHTSMFCDDWLLALDAAHYGFTQRANYALICGHIDGRKTLWPDIDADKFVRIEEQEIDYD